MTIRDYGKYCCPFSKDSVFKINDIVYEIIDRIDYWNVQRQREEFKYQMRGFGNDGEWFEVTHYKLINTPYKVASRDEFKRRGMNVFNYRE